MDINLLRNTRAPLPRRIQNLARNPQHSLLRDDTPFGPWGNGVHSPCPVSWKQGLTTAVEVCGLIASESMEEDLWDGETLRQEKRLTDLSNASSEYSCIIKYHFHKEWQASIFLHLLLCSNSLSWRYSHVPVVSTTFACGC